MKEVIFWFALFLAAFYIPPILYFKLGWFRHFYHDILEWHQPDDSPEWCDGVSMHTRCKYCGKMIMQDSQGNWF